MSQSLYARPHLPKEGTGLDDALKFALRGRYPDLWKPHVFDSSDMDYLSGLADGSVAGARRLIEMIQKYGQVEVWLE